MEGQAKSAAYLTSIAFYEKPCVVLSFERSTSGGELDDGEVGSHLRLTEASVVVRVEAQPFIRPHQKSCRIRHPYR